MNESEILKALQPIFDELFQETLPVVSMELNANDVPEWDSLMNVQLMVAAEKTFNVSFSAIDIESLKTVADLVLLIRNKLP